ncbi:MAG: hypothetical protein HC889_00510 [Synechococcaceae cyanobacterium SM1_2_3]|nr:hypothetical protein [Synechococcaceae cyanobacterium SM1_2_3]
MPATDLDIVDVTIRPEHFDAATIWADGNVDLLSGRLGEIAYCRFTRLDPMRALNWKQPWAHNIDLNVRGNVGVDVKTSRHAFATKVVWPLSRARGAHWPSTLSADLMVLARFAEPDGSKISLMGLCTRSAFLAYFMRSNGNDGLVAGTPYLHRTHTHFHPMASHDFIVSRLGRRIAEDGKQQRRRA